MRVCLFDIDGTLINSGGAGKAAMLEALRTEFGVRETLPSVPFAGRTDRAIGYDLLRAYGVEDDEANWQRLRAAYLTHLPACLARHPGRILPGVAALLAELRTREGVVVGLLTGNVRAGARIKLEHFSLFQHFAFGGFGDRHLCRDDVAREAIRAAEAHLRTPPHPDRLWVIGDTPLDGRCARAVGARAVAVATGWHSAEQLAAENPDLLLTDLSDPAEVLSLWRA